MRPTYLNIVEIGSFSRLFQAFRNCNLQNSLKFEESREPLRMGNNSTLTVEIYGNIIIRDGDKLYSFTSVDNGFLSKNSTPAPGMLPMRSAQGLMGAEVI